MLYLDTSLVVGLLLDEVDSAALRTWFAASRDEFVTSVWTLTEVASALSIKERTGALVAADRALADRGLSRLLDEEIDVVSVVGDDLRMAERMAGRPSPPLRASDALHLAVAARLGAVVHTLDIGQASAALDHGLAAVVTVERENPA